MESDTQTTSYYPVYKTLARALNPSVIAYKKILNNNEKVTIYQVFLWDVACNCINLCSALLALAAFDTFRLSFAIVGIGLISLYVLVWLLVTAGIGHWIAGRLLDTTASSRQLVLVYGASFAAITIVTAFLNFIGIGISSLEINISYATFIRVVLLSIYQVVLCIKAVQAVYSVGKLRAAIIALPLIIGAMFTILISIWIYLVVPQWPQ